jgi:hypothetical protein
MKLLGNSTLLSHEHLEHALFAIADVQNAFFNSTAKAQALREVRGWTSQ